MSTNSWHVFATHTVAETWCQKILCHLCQWHCAGWSMAGCSRLCNPFPRHRRCRCARTAQHNYDQLANKHALPRRWPNRSWHQIVCLSNKRGPNASFRSSDIQIWNVGLCFFQTSWIWVWRWTIGLQTGSYWHSTKPSALGYICQVSWPEKTRRLRKSRNNKCDSSLVHQWQIYI